MKGTLNQWVTPSASNLSKTSTLDDAKQRRLRVSGETENKEPDLEKDTIAASHKTILNLDDVVGTSSPHKRPLGEISLTSTSAKRRRGIEEPVSPIRVQSNNPSLIAFHTPSPQRKLSVASLYKTPQASVISNFSQTPAPPPLVRKYERRAPQASAPLGSWPSAAAPLTFRKYSPIPYQREVQSPGGVTTTLSPSPQRTLLFSNPLPKSPASTLTGISNIGNSCYMNAVLQALSCLGVFIRDLQAWLPFAPNPGLSRALFSIVSRSSTNRLPANPETLKSFLPDAFKTSFRQEDAHEFFLALLTSVETELSSISSTSQASNEAFRQVMRTNLSQFLPTRRMYSEITKSIKCLGSECFREASVMPERFTCHSVDFQHPTSSSTLSFPEGSAGSSSTSAPLELISLLRAHFATINVELKCLSCSSGAAKLSFKFTVFPQILTIHLKRFELRLQGADHIKRRDMVSFPMSLDLSEFAAEQHSVRGANWPLLTSQLRQAEAGSSPVALTGPSSTPSLRPTYRLVGVVRHIGVSPRGGHYVTNSMDRLTRAWYEYNDALVEHMSPGWEQREDVQRTAFMLFYALEIPSE